MTNEELHKMWIDKGQGMKALKSVYQQGREDAENEFAKRIEKLNTIEKIMLQYNADWYADEDNGVPDCEVLESIWNVIQDNGLDIDIEQDYRKGRADAIDEYKNALHKEFEKADKKLLHWIDFVEMYNKVAEQLKENKNEY